MMSTGRPRSQTRPLTALSWPMWQACASSPRLRPAPGHRVQEGPDPHEVVGPVHHGDHGERARAETGLAEDHADVLGERVDAGQPACAGEPAQQRMAQHGPADLGVLDAVHRAAHVELEQPQAVGLRVQVRPGQLGDAGRPGPPHRRDLGAGHSRGPAERRQVAAEQPVGQAD
jgi:hypothetical protein